MATHRNSKAVLLFFIFFLHPSRPATGVKQAWQFLVQVLPKITVTVDSHFTAGLSEMGLFTIELG